MKLDNCIYKGAKKSVYLDGNKAVKVFEKDYSKSDVLYEALNTARVQDSGMDIPEILNVTKENDQWMIVSEFVDGKNLAELMKENPDKIPEYIDKFVDFQIEINSHSNPLLIKLKDKMYRKIDSLDSISSSTKFELLARLESMPKHTKLCHGDFEPANIIVSDDGTFHAVDWVHATQGNASADVAQTYLLLSLKYPKYADKYIDTFCAKTGTAKQYVLQWLPIVAASQLTKDNSPKEEEILKKWVDVVDFQ